MSNINEIGLVVWGLKNGYQVFFSSDNINVKEPEIQKTLEDARVLINYSSVDLKFYSLEWTKKHKVFTGYMAIFDWSNRKNAYLAMSLFVPYRKRIDGGAQAVVDKLIDTYRQKYIGEDYRIKRGTEDKQAFFEIVNAATVLDDAVGMRQQPNKPTNSGYGLIRYEKGDMKGFFENPYLPEYEEFKEIFFLPEGQNRLKASPVIKPILDDNDKPIKPRPLTFPVSITVKLADTEEAPDGSMLSVKIGGFDAPERNGVYFREFRDHREQVSVMVSYEGYITKNAGPREVQHWTGPNAIITLDKKPEPKPEPAPKPAPPPVTSHSAPLDDRGNFKYNKGPDSTPTVEDDKQYIDTTVWSANNQRLDGPFTVQFSIVEADTKRPVILGNGSQVKLMVTNLGGTFYSTSAVLTIKGLRGGETLKGNVTVEGYRVATFKQKIEPGKNTTQSVLDPYKVELVRAKGATQLTNQSPATNKTAQGAAAGAREGKKKRWDWKKIMAVGVGGVLLGFLAAYGIMQLLKTQEGQRVNNQVNRLFYVADSTQAAMNERFDKQKDKQLIVLNSLKDSIELNDLISQQQKSELTEILDSLDIDLKEKGTEAKDRLDQLSEEFTRENVKLRLEMLSENAIIGRYIETGKSLDKELVSNRAGIDNVEKEFNGIILELEKDIIGKKERLTSSANAITRFANKLKTYQKETYDEYLESIASEDFSLIDRSLEEERKRIEAMKEVAIHKWDYEKVEGKRVSAKKKLIILKKDPRLTSRQRNFVAKILEQ